jgi:hypothetical protein
MNNLSNATVPKINTVPRTIFLSVSSQSGYFLRCLDFESRQQAHVRVSLQHRNDQCIAHISSVGQTYKLITTY